MILIVYTHLLLGEKRAIKAMNKDQIDDKEALENELAILKSLVKLCQVLN